MVTPEELRAIVSAALPPRPVSPRPIVVLGSGGIVRDAHLPAYQKAGFPVAALADRTPGVAAALAEQYAIPHTYESVEEAIAKAPKDAIFDIAVPAPQILNILPHLPEGAACLIQKPMGETLEEARAIRDLCRQRSLIAAVNFQLRYAPNNLGAQALAAKGLLGDLHDMEVQIRVFMPWKLWTFLSTAPRLELLYHSIHYLDLVRAWFGNPLGVYCKTVRNPQTPSLAATKSTVILDYGDNKRVFVAANHGHDFAPDYQRSFVQIEGTGGGLRFDMGVNLDYPKGRTDTLSYARRDGDGWHDLPVRGNWFPDAFLGSMGALQAHVEDPTKPLPTGFESAYETMALVEACYLSSAKPGETIPL
jgi:predicted dehydrogenase